MLAEELERFTRASQQAPKLQGMTTTTTMLTIDVLPPFASLPTATEQWELRLCLYVDSILGNNKLYSPPASVADCWLAGGAPSPDVLEVRVALF